MSTSPDQLTRKDFVSDQDVRWCPGCGDYAILGAVQNLLPTLGVPKENIVFISGIGCSSRFPFYVDTFGFHTVHGRAPTVASGVKCVNPDLDVWLVTGDGDGFSIGGNHMLHLLRRNVRLKVLLFNNRIYGLTKGQYSPTSPAGHKSKSTPLGSIDHPVHPCTLALGAEATFVARAADKQLPHLQQVLQAAHEHEGTAFVEILQNCVIFNDNTWEGVYGKDVRSEKEVLLEHGQPLRFGQDNEKGIRLKGYTPEVVTIGENGVTEDDLLVHDAHCEDPSYAYLLSRLGIDNPDLPLPLGVLRSVKRPTYEQQMQAQTEAAIAAAPDLTLSDMYRGFGKVSTWDVA